MYNLFGVLEVVRTPDLSLRRRLHSPAVLRGHGYTLTSLLTNENLGLYLFDVPQILFDSNH